MRRAQSLLAVLSLTGLLGGCVAVAIPIMAGGLIAKKQSNRSHAPKPPKLAKLAKPARQHHDRPVVRGRIRPVAPKLVRTLDAPEAQAAAPRIPAPVPLAVEPGSYGSFSSYAFERSRPGAAGEVRRSVVYDPDSPLAQPRMHECGNLGPAVLIDLDPGSARFDPAGSGPMSSYRAEPGLPEALDSLRLAGVTVLWASDLPVDQAEALYAKLRETRLDPAGTDRLLLQARPDDAKQARRQAAAKSYCIVAMAGDRRGDFDELYDYLRDPAAAAALEPNIGTGWFLVPLPIH